ncbi:MAG: 50S ribosomal protein L1 [Patescibacteria group bacterium]|nr:50S ribosomal protein L1 [Patescibacteria group bacterium]
MGKIRVKTFGDEEEEKKQKVKLGRKKEAKKIEKSSIAKATEGQEAKVKAGEVPAEPEIEAKEEKTETPEPKKEKKEKFQKKQKAFHSNHYSSLLVKVDRSKTYPLSEALGLLLQLQRNKFDETVELHINTLTGGISGNVTLPHGTGKKTKVAVVTDALIAEIEKGIINFDVLVAVPQMMAKLAKVAKVLGPRGLMPNPKTGTITDKPEELVKKYEGGQINFKTEGKAPILHLTVGKMSFGAKKLEENIESLLKAVKKSNIVNITLKSTMSPGIKIKA